jgi:hypothetical protein
MIDSSFCGSIRETERLWREWSAIVVWLGSVRATGKEHRSDG